MNVIVKLHNTYFKPGSLVTGDIVVQVKEKTEITNFLVRLTKKQYVKIDTDTSKFDNYALNNVIYDKVHESNNNLSILPGEHIFPFKFMLNCSDFASTNLTGYFNDTFIEFKNQYMLYSRVNNTKSQEILLNIYQETDKNLQTDIVFTKSNMLCAFKKQNLYFRINKQSYLPGDLMIISLGVDHKKKSRILSSTFRLYENFMYKNKLLRSRLVSETSGIYNNQDEFVGKMRLPGSLAATCKETEFEVYIILEAEISLHKNNIKVKKHINVKNHNIQLPTKEDYFDLDSIKHPEQVFDFQ